MTIQALILLALQASIFLAVLTVGMGTSGTDLRYVLSKPSRLARALVALNILGPAFAILVRAADAPVEQGEVRLEGRAFGD